MRCVPIRRRCSANGPRRAAEPGTSERDDGAGLGLRDDANYAPLHGCDRAGLAWEWLRRDPAYRADHARWHSAPHDGRTCPAIRHGLVAFVDPDLPAPVARPVWHRRLDPYVLAVEACTVDAAHSPFPIDALAPLATLHACPCGVEHLLLSDGARHVRVDIVAGTLRAGPVHLHWRVGDRALAPRHLLVMARLLALVRHGRFLHCLFRPQPWLTHRINELRVHDALLTGATYHQIARALYPRLVPPTGWRIEGGPYRSRVMRLRKAAAKMAAGDWRSLLR